MTSIPEPLLTDDERDKEIAALSVDDLRNIASYVADQAGGVFDEALRALKTYPGRQEASA